MAFSDSKLHQLIESIKLELQVISEVESENNKNILKNFLHDIEKIKTLLEAYNEQKPLTFAQKSQLLIKLKQEKTKTFKISLTLSPEWNALDFDFSSCHASSNETLKILLTQCKNYMENGSFQDDLQNDFIPKDLSHAITSLFNTKKDWINQYTNVEEMKKDEIELKEEKYEAISPPVLFRANEKSKEIISCLNILNTQIETAIDSKSDEIVDAAIVTFSLNIANKKITEQIISDEEKINTDEKIQRFLEFFRSIGLVSEIKISNMHAIREIINDFIKKIEDEIKKEIEKRKNYLLNFNVSVEEIKKINPKKSEHKEILKTIKEDLEKEKTKYLNLEIDDQTFCQNVANRLDPNQINDVEKLADYKPWKTIVANIGISLICITLGAVLFGPFGVLAAIGILAFAHGGKYTAYKQGKSHSPCFFGPNRKAIESAKAKEAAAETEVNTIREKSKNINDTISHIRSKGMGRGVI